MTYRVNHDDKVSIYIENQVRYKFENDYWVLQIQRFKEENISSRKHVAKTSKNNNLNPYKVLQGKHNFA